MTQKKPFSFYRRKELNRVSEARRKNSVARKITAAQIAADKKAARLTQLFTALAPEREIPSGLTFHIFISARNREYQLGEALQNDHGAFCAIPLKKSEARAKSAGRNKTKPRDTYDRPALRRVVFAGFTDPPNLYAISDIPECSEWLLVNGRPATVTGRAMARFIAETEKHRRASEIKAHAHPGASVRPSEPHPAWENDEIATIKRLEGPYAVLSKLLMGKEVKVDLSKLEIVRAA